jgi:hypothetical protein
MGVKDHYTLAMQYAWETWTVCNDIEYDADGDPTKTRLIQKKLWSIEQMGEAINHPYEERRTKINANSEFTNH